MKFDKNYRKKRVKHNKHYESCLSLYKVVPRKPF